MKKILAAAFAVLAICGVVSRAQTENYPQTSLLPAYGSDSGTATAFVASQTGCTATLKAGAHYLFQPSHNNSGTTPTLAWCAATAHTITRNGQSAIVVNDLTTTATADVVWDGTDFELQNPQTIFAGLCSGTCAVAGNTWTSGYLIVGGGSGTGTANSNDVVQTDGHFSTYAGMTTAGVGLDTILGTSDVTAQSTSQTSVNVLASTPAAGHYHVHIYLDQSAVCTTGNGSVFATVNWTDASHARSATTVALTLATAQSTASGFITADVSLWSATASAISYTTTVLPCATGTGTYDLHSYVDRAI